VVGRERRGAEEAAIEAHLEAELTRYLEQAQAETTPPRLLELARELQRRLRERVE
jgi:DNA transposition AAA+ family ATPase